MVRSLALNKGWMARPVKERWHKNPTALMGGIAINAGIVAPLIFSSDFTTIFLHLTNPSHYSILPSVGATICIGVTFLFLLGLTDDFIHIKPHTKLVGQILVASMVAFLGFRLQWFTSLTLDTIITIFWIVGITNAFNLLDNMDGLCAGVGGIAACSLVFLFPHQFAETRLVALVLAGSLAAFLIYNSNPASIFMGDSGSLVIGFTLSVLCLQFSETHPGSALSRLSVPIMILLVPILDTTMVTLVRLLSGRKASVGGKDHTSHRLVLMGFSERRAVFFLYGVGLISGIAGIIVSRQDNFTCPAVIIPVAVSVLLMGIYLAQIRVYPQKEFSLLRDKTFTPILLDLTYKRQMLLVILDFSLIAFVYYLSYRIRFDAEVFPFYFKVFLKSLPVVIACKFVAFFTIGVYRGVWGQMSSNDVFVQVKSSVLATVLAISMVTLIYRFENFSKGIFLIDWLLTLGFLLGTRGSFRLFSDTLKRRTLTGDKVLIYGAGRGGEILLREIFNNGKLNVKPIGFIDDDPLKAGKKLQGYSIFSGFNELDELLAKYPISGLLISFHQADPHKIENVKHFCRSNGLFLRQFSVHIDPIDLSD